MPHGRTIGLSFQLKVFGVVGTVLPSRLLALLDARVPGGDPLELARDVVLLVRETFRTFCAAGILSRDEETRRFLRTGSTARLPFGLARFSVPKVLGTSTTLVFTIGDTGGACKTTHVVEGPASSGIGTAETIGAEKKLAMMWPEGNVRLRSPLAARFSAATYRRRLTAIR